MSMLKNLFKKKTKEKKDTVPEFKYTRKILRNMLRNQVGNRNMKHDWRKHQLNKYGIKQYNLLRNMNLPSRIAYMHRKEQLTF